MKTKIIVISLLCLLGFAGCGEDDTLSPSYADKNWLAIEDDPNDPLTHLRYKIYTEQGVAIHYNDTLGSEIRYNAAGDPYTYYEMFLPGYAISSKSTPIYTLADDEADVMDMVELMDEYLFKYLPKDRGPLVYFLVDTLVHKTNIDVPYSYYKYLTTVCVGRIEEVKHMNDSARKSFMAELAGMEFMKDVVACEKNEELNLEFDSVTMRVVLPTTYAPVRLGWGTYSTTVATRLVSDPELFGFLRYRNRIANFVYSISKEQDRASYIGLILSCTDAEIRERYKKYPAVIEKYEAMREMMVNAGFLEE